MGAHVKNHWLSLVLCWHRRKHRRVMLMNNGIVLFCVRCNTKRATIWEDNPDRSL